MSDDRIKQLSDAGMQFKPTGITKSHKERIDALTPEEFASLLSLTGKLTKSPTFLTFDGGGNGGLQQRSYEEP